MRLGRSFSALGLRLDGELDLAGGIVASTQGRIRDVFEIGSRIFHGASDGVSSNSPTTRGAAGARVSDVLVCLHSQLGEIDFCRRSALRSPGEYCQVGGVTGQWHVLHDLASR